MFRTLALTGAATALLAGTALAADLPVRAAPPVFTPVPVFTWTGFYAGLHTDYFFTDRQRITTRGNDVAPTNTIANVATGRRAPVVFNETDGFANIGGGFGYNYQFTPGGGLVVGAQADWAWTDLSKRTVYFSALNDPSLYRQNLDWLGTVTGRVGWAFDRFLVYGMGGFAYGNVEYQAAFFSNGPGNPLAYAGRFNDLQTGFAYGGGVEYAIPADSFLARFNVLGLLGFQTSSVTLKAEYLHYDLGSRNVIVNNVGLVVPPPAANPRGSYTSRFTTEGNLVRVGFTYKFGGL
ncbi:outer membrane protein [Methylobacterium oryzisoli]|uniref:outer membrane protein n=1 Tax=Methylobacterium oryzisoli TaxID=3385502 RepID=UPI003891FC30